MARVDEADPSIAYVADGEHFHLYFDVADADARATASVKRGDN